LNLPKEVF